MPQINVVPDKVIQDSFKILSRQRQSPERKKDGVPSPIIAIRKQDEPETVQTYLARDKPLREREVIVEEILLSHKSSSVLSSHPSDSRDISQTVCKKDDFSIGSVDENKNDDRGRMMKIDVRSKASENAGLKAGSEAGGDLENQKKRKITVKKQEQNEDERRRNSWIPCTCPQYKVSKDLANRKDVQAVFFAKVMVVKVTQLLIINLVAFSVAYEREATIHFFKKSHDWVYLAYGLFVALLLCVRVGMSYRARWNPIVSFVLLIPMTAIIAFTSGCITVVYNSMLVPLITCTVLLSILMTCFAPYLFRKFVMHRATNFIAAGLTTLSSIILIFLKEFEPTPMTYWQFISQIWLPAFILSHAIVQISIIELQRMLFGLCFNISSKRWHIAAAYL